MARDYYTYFRKDKDGNEITLKGFSISGCGTSTNFIEISKEEYDRYKAMTKGELHNEVRNQLTEAQVCGYGYYGAEIREEDGMYFLGTCLGNSCD